MISNGVDLVRIARVEAALKRASFLEKVFGRDERAELMSRGMPAESAAAAFAAKEAFGKALGVGLSGFSLCEVQVLHREDGSPYLSLLGRARALVERRGAELALSISHDGEYALALITCLSKEE